MHYFIVGIMFGLRFIKSLQLRDDLRARVVIKAEGTERGDIFYVLGDRHFELAE